MRTLLWTGLKPRGRDVFSATFADEPGATDITLIFRRDANGRIRAFELIPLGGSVQPPVA